MRVAFIHIDLPPASRGGVAHQVDQLAEKLAERGHEVTVITTSGPPAGRSYSVAPVRFAAFLRCNRPLRILLFPVLVACRSYAGFDLIHAHGDSHFLWRRRIPVVRTFHGSAKQERINAVSFKRKLSQLYAACGERLARCNADATSAVSRNTERSVGFVDRIIPCAIDIEVFKPRAKACVPTIMAMGNLYGRKRNAHVVKTFCDEIRAAVPSAELWLVSPEQPQQAGGVYWFDNPPTEEVATRFSEAWIFCSASSYEGFGVPYLEAIASGTPVVCTHNLGADELLGNTSSVTFSELSDIGRTLIDVLILGLPKADSADVNRFRQTYSWERVVAAYLDLYQLALSRKRVGADC